MRSNTVLTVIFVLVVATVLVGEVYVYTFNTDRYSSEVTMSADGIDYSVTSGGTSPYSVLVFDNGSFEKSSKYYIYYDSDYRSNVEDVFVPVGAKAFTEDYYISQLIKMFEYRGITDISVLNATELRSAMDSDISSGNITNGLIVLSGALPDTVYQGNASDTIFNWLQDGGRLYWAGNLLGAFYSTTDDIIDVPAGYQTLFFGSECLNIGDTERAMSDVTTNDLRHTLSLMNNNVKYGIDVTGISGTYLEMGYTEEGYSSIVMTEFGNGMICVLAGDYSNNQRHDLAQIVSSGVCHLSVPAGYAGGTIERSTVNGHIDITFIAGSNYIAYVYYGGYYPIYGMVREMIA
jgi:hypothetical protein